MSTVDIFKKELNFINKFKNHKNFDNIFVSFLNFPNELHCFLKLMNMLIRDNKWEKTFLNLFLEKPNYFLQCININYDTNEFKFGDFKKRHMKYEVLSPPFQ